jgi:tRNA/rRNA methyltransferase/tRNA (cytidine32/uridine32-2'-O)-methyltransferase
MFATGVFAVHLDDIIIVLARPSESGNSGAICRAMKNMGLSRLRIAAPNYRAGHDPADRGLPWGPELETLLARAIHAAEIWHNAEYFSSLEAALADCAVTVGTTRRRGKRRKSASMSPRELAAFLKNRNGNAAVVFGNERTGLEDGELALCTLASHIPASPKFPSINLSHAVQIYVYELYCALGEDAAPRNVPGQWVPLTHEESTDLALHVCASLERLGFYRRPGREEQEQFLRDLFARAGLTPREGRYLEAFIAKAARLAEKKRRSAESITSP